VSNCDRCCLFRADDVACGVGDVGTGDHHDFANCAVVVVAVHAHDFLRFAFRLRFASPPQCDF
jgi:hypothetical protein